MPLEPTDNEIRTLEELYHQSRFLDAYQFLAAFPPSETWANADARLMAARTFRNLGADRRAGHLFQSTWRKDRSNIAAFYYHALHFADRHGAFETLRLIEQTFLDQEMPAPTDDRHLVYIWLLRARLLAQFHDFDAAEPWLAAAEQIIGQNPWTQVEKCGIRLAADRYDEALAAARQACVLNPDYRPGIQILAHVLGLHNQDEEAESLLRRASARMQSTHIMQQFAMLLIEKEKFADAALALEAAERFSPLAEKPWRDWLNGRRADVLYRLDRHAEAVACARQVPGAYYKNFAQRLETANPPERNAPARRQLPVGFVRQHNVTCAPATISAISAFWLRPIDHLALARVITYDGTPDHEERHWLESHGWHVREFRVTWETGCALLARGVPFTLVTTWVHQAHLQAVVGYDAVLGTFVIRDPYFRVHTEALEAELLAQQAPFGPRGMVLIPPEEAHRLDGIELPDSSLYDAWFHLRRALVRHDRATAEARARWIEQEAPDHRLALWARRQLAYYDDNPARTLEFVTALRIQFPDEPNLQLEERALLQRLGRRDDNLQKTPRRDADPAFWRDYAEHLRTHARRGARRWARRLVHLRPLDWANLSTFAHVLWDAREFALATRVYRLAATMGDKVEQPWRSFFAASRHERHLDEALALLQARWQRLGAASSQPAQTLCQCLESLHRTVEAREVLKQALALRPEDGELRLFAAETAARTGDFGQAREYLLAAKNHVAGQAWQRTAATLAAWQADHSHALLCWRTVLDNNPLDAQALRETARLLAFTTGREQMLAWLAEQVGHYPHFLPLRQLRLEWLRSEPSAIALREVEDYLALHPADAWALRERALILLRARQPEAALQSAKLAEAADPRAPASAGVVGQSLLALQRYAEAREATERGLRLSIDADWLMPQLVSTCLTFVERRAAVEFLCGELLQQSALGGGFLRFHEVATGVLAPEELQKKLESMRVTRSEHWEVWSISAQQALAQNQPDHALALAEEATRRFPLLPRLWLDLANVHRFCNNPEKEMEALVRARELAPGWANASLRLANLHERALHPVEAEDVLRTAVQHDPLNPELHAKQARLLWTLGRQEAALAGAEHALRLAPAYAFAWNLLAHWSQALGQSNRVTELARQLAEQRPGDPAPHLRLAREFSRLEQFDDALAEVQTALKLAPTEIESHDLHAVLLASLARYDEALSACAPAGWVEGTPRELSGRAAWVEWQRGNRRGAVEAIRQIVATHADYIFGWRLLAEWLDVLGDKKQAGEAAEKLAALEPDSPYPLGYVADLKIKAGEKRAAADFLRRALRLDPAYGFAAFALLRLQCEWEEFAEAERTLALIRQHASSWSAWHGEILLQRARRDRAAAQRALRDLCRAPEHATEALTSGAQVFLDAGWEEPLIQAIEAVLPEPGVNPEAGACWMRARLNRGKRPRLRWLDRCGAGDRLRQRAYTIYLNWLGQKKLTFRLLRLLWRRGRWLRAGDETWGEASFALGKQGTIYRRWLVRWMRDWPRHKNAQPWMLYNLTQALYSLGRDAEAERAVKAALQMPADHTRPAFVGWAALSCALRGDDAMAKRLLSAHDGKSQFKSANIIAELARSLVAVAGEPPERRKAEYREQREKLRTLQAKNAGEFRLQFVRRAHGKTLRALARMAGDKWGQIRLAVTGPLVSRFQAGQPVLALLVLVLMLVAFVVLVSNTDGGAAVVPVGIAIVWILRFAQSGRRRTW